MNRNIPIVLVWLLACTTFLTAGEPSAKPAPKPAAKSDKRVPPNSQLVRQLEAGKQQTVVTYGTSLTAVGAWVDQLRHVLETNYPGQVEVINSGSGGSNSKWGRENLGKRVIAKNPDTVFLEFAMNDANARRSTSVEMARDNLENMLDRILKAHPRCELILMVMNPAVAHTGADRPELEAYYQLYRQVAKERGLLLIDHYPAWQKLMRENPGRFMEYMPDTIHPVRRGAAAIITPTLLEAIGIPKEASLATQEAPCWKYLFHLMDRKARDGMVSRQEYADYWMEQLAKQDQNKDGVLQAMEHPPEVLFRYIDANDDGTVDREEYLRIYQPHFDARDRNQDDVLSAEERSLVVP